jgi:hypothetical protein
MKGVRFEKVDDNTLRVIIEKPDDVQIEKLIENRAKVLESIEAEQKSLDTHEAETQQRASIEAQKKIIANIDEMLKYCKLNGIVPKPNEIAKKE